MTEVPGPVTDIQHSLLDRYKQLLDLAMENSAFRKHGTDQIAECRTACRLAGVGEASMDRELLSRFPAQNP